VASRRKGGRRNRGVGGVIALADGGRCYLVDGGRCYLVDGGRGLRSMCAIGRFAAAADYCSSWGVLFHWVSFIFGLAMTLSVPLFKVDFYEECISAISGPNENST
jgi:hypothetical protein